ncbi:MAG: hypothetical protein ACRDTN_20950 [Mycobacterium sp.]
MFREEARAVSGRSFLVAGVAAVSAAAVALAPSVTPRPAAIPEPAAQLTAAVLPLDPLDLPGLAGAASSIGGGINDLYLALEQWAQYGVNLLSWAVGWVPFVGVLAPQLNFFYDLGESIVQSMVFNAADLLDGTIDFAQALSNIGDDTTTAFNAFINTETNWLQSLLPPFPPLAANPTELVDGAAALDPGPDGLLDLGAPADLTPELGGVLLSLVP